MVYRSPTNSVASSAGLCRQPPSFHSDAFRGLAVLQLDDVLLPPACTGAYAFESDVGIMGAALGTSLLYISAVSLGSRTPRWFSTAGGASLRVLLLLFAPATRDLLSLLDCQTVSITASAAATLDGGTVPSGQAVNAGSRAAAITSVSVLSGNPYVVCWSNKGSHNAAGALAVVSFLVVIAAFPVVSWLTVTVGRRYSDLCQAFAMRILCARDAASAGKGRRGIFRRQVSSGLDPVIITTQNPLRRDAHDQALPLHPSQKDAAWPLALTDPFLANYVSSAFYTRHLDLALTLTLSAVQAFLPNPWNTATLVGKAAIISTASLMMAFHTVYARPFIAEQSWKGPVRASLLCLAAACSVVDAFAGALDLGLVWGRAAQEGLAAGAYLLLVLFIVVLVLLVGGIARAMLRGARADQAAISSAAIVPAAYPTAELRDEPAVSSLSTVDNHAANVPITTPQNEAEADKTSSGVIQASIAPAQESDHALPRVSFSSNSVRRSMSQRSRSRRQTAGDLRSAVEILDDPQSSIADISAAWDELAVAKMTPEQVRTATQPIVCSR